MPEDWRSPRFLVAGREAQLPDGYVREWMRRELCCDCGETVVFSGSTIMWGLTRPWVYICTVCARKRQVECGGTAAWTRNLAPEPRDP